MERQSSRWSAVEMKLWTDASEYANNALLRAKVTLTRDYRHTDFDLKPKRKEGNNHDLFQGAK